MAMGNLTDDELANGAFLNYDRKLDVEALMAKKPGYYPPIAWMTAVKDRIRWLSRSLEKATAPSQTQLVEAFDACIAAELPRVSHVQYDSYEICKRFASEVRKRITATPVPSSAPMEMCLCEAKKLVLRVGQPYVFRPMKGCKSCEEAMREAVEAYGPGGGEAIASSVTASAE